MPTWDGGKKSDTRRLNILKLFSKSRRGKKITLHVARCCVEDPGDRSACVYASRYVTMFLFAQINREVTTKKVEVVLKK